MDLENFHARLLIGQGDLNLAVQPWEVIDCCGGMEHERGGSVKAIQFDKLNQIQFRMRNKPEKII